MVPVMELNGSALLEDFDLEFDEPRAEEADDGDEAFDSDVELEVAGVASGTVTVAV